MKQWIFSGACLGVLGFLFLAAPLPRAQNPDELLAVRFPARHGYITWPAAPPFPTGRIAASSDPISDTAALREPSSARRWRQVARSGRGLRTPPRQKKIRENPPCAKGHCLIRQIGILNRPSRIEGAPAASYPYAVNRRTNRCSGKGKLVSRVIPFYVPACFKSRTKAKSAPTGPPAKVIEFRPAEAKKHA